MSLAHFDIDSLELQRILQSIIPIAGKSASDVAVATILFCVDRDGVILKASNGDIFTKIHFSCDVISGGSFVITSSLLSSVVKECKNMRMNFHLVHENDSEVLLISAGNLKYKIGTLSIAHDYYDVDLNALNPMQFSISSSSLKAIFDSILCCVDTKRLNSNGVLFHSEIKNEQNTLFAVATDRMRLAIYGYQIIANRMLDNIILPKKACDYIRSLLSSYSSDITVEIVGSIACFKIGSITVSARLIDAEFPRYQSVLPVANDKILDVKTDVLLSCINKVSAISSSSFAKVKFVIYQNILEVSCEDNGNIANDVLEVGFSDDNARIELFCNAQMLTEILQNINAAMVRFAILDHKSQILIRPLGETIDLRYVFMPIVN